MTDFPGQRGIRIPGKYFEIVYYLSHTHKKQFFKKKNSPHGLNHRLDILRNTREMKSGWAGRIRTFDTGSKVRGLTAWRPPNPELPAEEARPTLEERRSLPSQRSLAASCRKHSLVFRDDLLLYHSAGLVVDRMGDVFVSAVLALL